MTIICDTGPLLAYLGRSDPHHEWAVAVMKDVRAPMLVSDPVLTEVTYFLREDGLTVDPLFQLLERQAIQLGFDIASHWPRVRKLMARYRQMDLADASVVLMTELHARSQVLTIDDKDFTVYRRNDRQVINFNSPRKTRPKCSASRT